MTQVATPFCVNAGQTLEFDMAATLEREPNRLLGFALLKDDVMVAGTQQADMEGPSSLSMFYRETVSTESEFKLVFTVDTPNFDNNYFLLTNYFQMGVKILEGGNPITTMLPNNCAGPL